MGVIGDPLFALNLVDAAPDAETVRVLQELDLGAADRYECLAVMEVTNRLIAAMQGMQLAAMGRFITQYDPLARRYAAADVASALTWTTRATASRLQWGEHVTTTLPRTLAALCAGVVDIAKARTMIEQTEIIDPDIAGQVENTVIPQAENRTYRWFRDTVKRTIATLDPEASEQRRQAHRHPPGLRAPEVQAQPRARRLRQSQHPHLQLPQLQPASQKLRVGPHRPVSGRPNLGRQSQTLVQVSP